MGRTKRLNERFDDSTIEETRRTYEEHTKNPRKKHAPNSSARWVRRTACSTSRGSRRSVSEQKRRASQELLTAARAMWKSARTAWEPNSKVRPSTFAACVGHKEKMNDQMEMDGWMDELINENQVSTLLHSTDSLRGIESNPWFLICFSLPGA